MEVTIFVYCAIESESCGWLQQEVEQDPNLTAEEKKHRRHKIEEELAAGLGAAAVGYEVRYVQRSFTSASSRDKISSTFKIVVEALLLSSYRERKLPNFLSTYPVLL